MFWIRSDNNYKHISNIKYLLVTIEKQECNKLKILYYTIVNEWNQYNSYVQNNVLGVDIFPLNAYYLLSVFIRSKFFFNY